MNNNESRFITWLGIAGVTVLLSAFVLTLFGIIDLRIEVFNDNKIFRFIINFILFELNLYFIFCITIGNNSIKPLLYNLPISLISNIFLENSLIVSWVIPFIFIIIYNACLKQICFKKLIKFHILLTLFIATYQSISCYIKLLNFNIVNLNGDFISNLIVSIDLYLVYYFLMKGVNGDYVGLCTKLAFLSESKSVRQAEEPSEEVLNVEELTKRQEAVFRLLAGGYQIFQLLVVLGIGVINNMWIELVIMLIVFWNGRKILGNCWHSEKLSICSAATFTGFYILTKITPPLSISLFLVICLCGMFTYFMYVLGLKSDRLEYLEKSKIVSDSEILKLKQKLEIMNGEFSSYRFSRKMESFAIDWLTNNMSDKELMLKHEINSENTLNSRKRRIKDKMNTI